MSKTVCLVCLIAAAIGGLLAWPAPVVKTGWAVYYGASWDWQRIAAIQGVSIPCGYTPVATADRAELGRRGALYIRGQFDRHIIVADYADPQDRARIVGNGIIVEVPYHAAAWRAEGRVPAVLVLWPDGWPRRPGVPCLCRTRPAAAKR